MRFFLQRCVMWLDKIFLWRWPLIDIWFNNMNFFFFLFFKLNLMCFMFFFEIGGWWKHRPLLLAKARGHDYGSPCLSDRHQQTRVGSCRRNCSCNGRGFDRFPALQSDLLQRAAQPCQAGPAYITSRLILAIPYYKNITWALLLWEH